LATNSAWQLRLLVWLRPTFLVGWRYTPKRSHCDENTLIGEEAPSRSATSLAWL
jgi:hypothetical protein